MPAPTATRCELGGGWEQRGDKGTRLRSDGNESQQHSHQPGVSCSINSLIRACCLLVSRDCCVRLDWLRPLLSDAAQPQPTAASAPSASRTLQGRPIRAAVHVSGRLRLVLSWERAASAVALVSWLSSRRSASAEWRSRSARGAQRLARCCRFLRISLRGATDDRISRFISRTIAMDQSE